MIEKNIKIISRGGIVYFNQKEIKYYSERYKKWVLVPLNYRSDGATGAIDINTDAWWVHDKLCDSGVFDDKSPCTNWQASMILRDILRRDNYYARATTWFISTWLFGGGKCRSNGMW
ncbi:hypothetical protein KAU11_03450 [Candidatus Babeliales bacterium]|nr:hypothetical protein [Candidatus Babeliales bacterium]